MARSKPTPIPRNCGRCGESFGSIDGCKFCKECKKVVLAELSEKGYFTTVPRRTFTKADNLYRSDNDGDPSPSQENGVRAMEGA